jgi:hypothetical protein
VLPIAAIVAVGNGFTTTTEEAVFEQPLASVIPYEIVADPDDTPVTTPVALTVAIEVFELDQVGFTLVVARFVVVPTQSEVLPVIAAVVGNAFTVTVVAAEVIEQPPALVTVTV